MRHVLVATSLFALFIVAGCDTIFRERQLSITPSQKQAIAKARNLCQFVDFSTGRVTLRWTVKAGGTALPDQVLKKHNGALPEAAVFKTLLHQELCVLSHTMESFPSGDMDAWESEVSKAFDTWRPVKADARVAELTAIRKAETEHIQAIGLKSGKSAAPMSTDQFIASIPVMDFLTVVEVDAGLALGPNSSFKGASLNGTNGKLEFKPDEFSNAIRPSLNRIRDTLGQYALKGITDVQLQQALVRSVYDAAAGRYAGLAQ